jgi:hypothetical protein
VGRICEATSCQICAGSGPWVYVDPKQGINTSGRAASLDEAKGAIPIELAEVPRRVDSLGSALYLAPTMSLRPRALPAGFIAPCLPTSAPRPPSGELWLHARNY